MSQRESLFTDEHKHPAVSGVVTARCCPRAMPVAVRGGCDASSHHQLLAGRPVTRFQIPQPAKPGHSRALLETRSSSPTSSCISTSEASAASPRPLLLHAAWGGATVHGIFEDGKMSQERKHCFCCTRPTASTRLDWCNRQSIPFCQHDASASNLLPNRQRRGASREGQRAA